MIGPLTPMKIPELLPPDPSCVLYMPMLEGIGAKTYDQSNFQNHGTLNNMIWNPNGIYGTGLNFDGTNGYVNCGNDKSLHISKTLTVEALLYNIGDGAYIINIYHKAEGKRQYNLRLNSQKLTVELSDNGSASGGHFVVLSGNTTMSKNKWYHLGFTFEGSITTLKLYVNGVRDGINSSTIINQIFTSNASLFLGTRQGLDTSYFEGALSLTAIYNEIKSAEWFAQRALLLGF